MKQDVTYNTGGTINGTIQKNNLAIANDNPDYTMGDWVGGVDNSDGYVIIGDTTSLGLGGRVTGNGTGVASLNKPTFWKSQGLNDSALLGLINRLPNSPGGFVDVTSARAWVDSSPYAITNDYNSGGGSYVTGDYKLSLVYAPAPMNGDITFPAHPVMGGAPGTANTDPNLVGTNDGTYSYQLYINTNDLTGTSQMSVLNSLVGNSGQITLRQNLDYVRYNFTPDAFKTGDYSGNVIYYDTQYGVIRSAVGSLTVDVGSESPFNVDDPITISITIL
jgi:hypothetical protein